jgi:hypothetical protein
MLSIVAHCAAIALLAIGAVYAPRINDRNLNEQYVVRHLDLISKEQQRRRSAESEIGYPDPKTLAHITPPGGSTAAQQKVQATPGPQTLVQPDLLSQLPLTHLVPVPTVVLWTPEKTPVKTVVPPRPVTPAAAEVLRPSLAAPNKELKLADVRISATALPTQKMPILPSNTSPLVVHGPELPQKMPTTTSSSSAAPTPAAALSLSNLRLTEGTIYLPPANESASSGLPAALAQGQGKDSSQPGSGNSTGKGAGTGTGQGADKPGGSKAGAAAGANTGGSGLGGDLLTTTHIALAKEGKFGAVVVGNTLEERYPELPKLLGGSGRLVYTVYLHLGTAKSWILQYSLPAAEDKAAAGKATSLEAPWPYDIVRPNMPPGSVDADFLMVHGFVNKNGRFEALNVVFPPGFEQAQFIVDALKQWQFRPAAQNGESATVEVLLIIPQEQE